MFTLLRRGQALVATCVLLTISAGGSAQGDKERQPQADSADKMAKLIAALKDRSYWPNQYRAAEALGYWGPKEAVPALAAAAKDDPQGQVRYAAARALGRIGSVSPEAIAALKAAAKDKEELVRDAAKEALKSFEAQLARSTDVPDLVASLKYTEPFFRQAAARRLGKVGPISPETMAALKAAAKDEDEQVRQAVQEACRSIAERLQHRPTREDVPLLIANLKDAEISVRMDAAHSLEKVGPPAIDAVPALVAASSDPQVRVRSAAVSALGKVASISAETIGALKAAAKDADEQVRKAAQQACASIGERLERNAHIDDVPLFVNSLKHTEPFVRQAAARALGRLGPLAAKAVPALAAASRDPEAQVRLAVVYALGKAGSMTPPALAALKAAAKDEDAQVRKAAQEAWPQIEALVVSTATVDDAPNYVASLKSPEAFVRRVAARALGKVAYAPEAVVALDAAAKDDDPDVRRAAREARNGIPPSITALSQGPTIAETFLGQGRLSAGEAALLERLKHFPKDDQARFGLGFLQFVRGVERLGQAFHKYGVKSESTNIPFLRLPVPANRAPAEITYGVFRDILAEFHRDLSRAESTLAGITDEKVKMPLRLAVIRMDLVGDGKSADKFLDILKKILHRQNVDFPSDNPEFIVGLDRGDVAWLRAYCHLLMGMLDFYLAFDTKEQFDLSADELFAKPERRFSGGVAERERLLWDASKTIAVKEPARLGQFRKHLIQVAELNRETWKHIRAEKDDDLEWLPNPGQKGVIGLPVRDLMIDGWLRRPNWKPCSTVSAP